MENITSDHHDHLPSASGEYEPTPDALIVGAYFRYVDQGSVPGHALSDWLDAEQLLQDDRRLDRRAGCP